MGIISLTCLHNFPAGTHDHWGFAHETHETHEKNPLPVPSLAPRRLVRLSGKAPPGKRAFRRSLPGWPRASLRAAPETDILLGLPFDAMDYSQAGKAGGREADGGRKGKPFGPAASPASPPGALPERLCLSGRVFFRVFRVFRGKVSRQVNDVNPLKINPFQVFLHFLPFFLDF